MFGTDFVVQDVTPGPQAAAGQELTLEQAAAMYVLARGVTASSPYLPG